MKKIISFLFVFVFILTVLAIFKQKTEAAISFPTGCSSAIGYSIINGKTCNGESNATNMIQGCSNPLGYSTTNGIPCSGVSQAIFYLGGCSSIYGYSTETGAPCNGKVSATLLTNSNTITPGLPKTGTNGLNYKLLLISFCLIIISGSLVYTIKQNKTA